ncbi:MAG: PAS-domain containing protein [Rhodospirillaceae bacterium]
MSGGDKARKAARWLVAFGSVMLLCINGLVAVDLWVGWEGRIANAILTTGRLAKTIADHTARTLSSTEHLLSGVSEVMAARLTARADGRFAFGDPEVTALLRRRAVLLPYIRAITLIDDRGFVINDSRTDAVRPLDLSDRLYFTVHRESVSERLFIDVPQISRIDGRWFFAISRRVPGANGGFLGVLNAVADPEYIRRFLVSLDIDPGGTAGLFNLDGVAYCQEPGLEAVIGKSLAGRLLFTKQLRQAPAGNFQETEEDGTQSIVGYASVSNYPLVAMASLSLSQVMAPWRQQLLYQFLAALLVDVFVVAFIAVLLGLNRTREADASMLAASEADAVGVRRQLADAIESMTEGFALFDRDERIVMFNSRYRKMVGSLGTILVPGLSYEELLRAVVATDFVVGARGAGKNWVESRLNQHRFPSGEPIEQEMANGEWVLAWIYPTREGGRVHIRTDITYLKRTQMEAIHQQLTLRTTVESIVQGLCVFDPNYHLVLWNRNWLKLLRLPAEFGRVGMPLAEVVRWRAERGDYGRGDIDDIVAYRMAALSVLDDHVGERVLSDGTVVEVQGVPMPGGGRLTTYSDITEHKRQQGELKAAKLAAERSNVVKTLFLAKMSHELRTPFNAIIGFAEIIANTSLGKDGEALDTYAGYAADIHQSAQHLLNLVNDILDVSKIESGRMTVSIERFDLRHTLSACFGMMRQLSHSQGVTLVLDFPEHPLDTCADERAIKQIVTNLLSNAIKFTSRGGSVTVCARATPKKGFEIKVIDTGVGIPLDQINRIMLPFEQVDNRYSRSTGGTGLGLALVKGLVELHGGQVVLQSQLGCGTSVTVTFPFSASPTQATPHPAPEPCRNGGQDLTSA